MAYIAKLVLYYPRFWHSPDEIQSIKTIKNTRYLDGDKTYLLISIKKKNLLLPSSF